jgi:hypothetical protein
MVTPPPLSLPGVSRQSMIADRTLLALTVIMDARNECGHDNNGQANERNSHVPELR